MECFREKAFEFITGGPGGKYSDGKITQLFLIGYFLLANDLGLRAPMMKPDSLRGFIEKKNATARLKQFGNLVERFAGAD